MVITGMLSGPPPCAACGSKEHGHLQLDLFTVACPLNVDVSAFNAASPAYKAELRTDGIHLVAKDEE